MSSNPGNIIVYITNTIGQESSKYTAFSLHGNHILIMVTRYHYVFMYAVSCMEMWWAISYEITRSDKISFYYLIYFLILLHCFLLPFYNDLKLSFPKNNKGYIIQMTFKEKHRAVNNTLSFRIRINFSCTILVSTMFSFSLPIHFKWQAMHYYSSDVCALSKTFFGHWKLVWEQKKNHKPFYIHI